MGCAGGKPKPSPKLPVNQNPQKTASSQPLPNSNTASNPPQTSAQSPTANNNLNSSPSQPQQPINTNSNLASPDKGAGFEIKPVPVQGSSQVNQASDIKKGQ